MIEEPSTGGASAMAHPNIAFIKYWGNRNEQLRLPENGSISMNLAGLSTRTSVQFDPSLKHDEFILNQKTVTGDGLTRVSAFLDIVRNLAFKTTRVKVISENDFPAGAGIASSASAFAALALATTAAFNLEQSVTELSRLARRGSGSACRSIPAGFTEWERGDSDKDSFAHSIATPDHWKLVDCIALIRAAKKTTGSTEGHRLARTSPIQPARVEDAPRRLKTCRDAILSRDFDQFAEVIELDSNLLHAVMMTSNPSLYYWLPPTIQVILEVLTWRKSGTPCAFTIDAGPNVHVICPEEQADHVVSVLSEVPGVGAVLHSGVGGAARFLAD
jgi:diphosphomevalonate decarboxylase